MKLPAASSMGAVCLAISAATAVAAPFADPTRANVLRQYTFAGVNAVTATNDSGLSRVQSNDGSGQIAYDSSFGTGIAQQTFTLPEPIRVGSYRLQFESSTTTAKQFEIQGRLGGGAWQTLKLLDGGAGFLGLEQAGSLDTALVVDQLRYIATAPSSGGQMFISELQIFADATQPAGIEPVTREVGAGNRRMTAFNVLRDPGVVTNSLLSSTGVHADFRAPNGGLSAAAMIDGSYRNSEHIPVNPQYTNQRIFIAFDLVPTQLNQVHLGVNRDQRIADIAIVDDELQIWTSNLADPDEYNDADWVLQASGTFPSGVSGFNYILSQPGVWTHLRLTMRDTSQNYGLLEIEAYGFVPEPGMIGAASLIGLTLVTRRRR
jgi:hypothetical protein